MAEPPFARRLCHARPSEKSNPAATKDEQPHRRVRERQSVQPGSWWVGGVADEARRVPWPPRGVAKARRLAKRGRAIPIDDGDRGALTYGAFVTKLSATGSALVYSTYLGGIDIDEGHGIAVDGAGSAYVTGVEKLGRVAATARRAGTP
jgi:hypothetical protein